MWPAASGDMKVAEQKQDDTNKELQEAVFRSMQDKQKQVSEEEECKDSEAKEETMGATNSEGNETKPAMSSGVGAVEVEATSVEDLPSQRLKVTAVVSSKEADPDRADSQGIRAFGLLGTPPTATYFTYFNGQHVVLTVQTVQ